MQKGPIVDGTYLSGQFTFKHTPLFEFGQNPLIHFRQIILVLSNSRHSLGISIHMSPFLYCLSVQGFSRGTQIPLLLK